MPHFGPAKETNKSQTKRPAAVSSLGMMAGPLGVPLSPRQTTTDNTAVTHTTQEATNHNTTPPPGCHV